MGRSYSAPLRGRPVKAVVLEPFSSILHLVQGPNVVELTGAGPSGGDRCGPAVSGGCGWMFGGLSRDDRRCAWRRCAGEPLAQLRVDTRVIQKVEVVRPCQQEPLLARKGQRSILTRAGRAVGAD